jgi:hypothetical protein
VVFGLILILVMIFMPQGLFRGVVETYERRSSLRTRTGRAGKALARRLGGFRRTSPEPKEQPAVSASGENGPGEAAQRAPTHGGTPKPQGEV